MLKHRRIDIFGHQTSLALEPEFWTLLYEIAGKIGVTIKTIIEGVAATKNPHRSLASELLVAITAYFHGNPYPIYKCPDGIVIMRNGDVLLGWGWGRPRKEGPRPVHVDQKHGTRQPRSLSRFAAR